MRRGRSGLLVGAMQRNFEGMLRLVSSFPARRWAALFSILGLLASGPAQAAGPPTVEPPSSAASGATPPAAESDEEKKLSELRQAALGRLEGKHATFLEQLPDAELLRLLNAPEGTKLSENEEKAIEAVYKESFERSLQYETGEIELAGGLARLSLSEEFRYLNPGNAQRLLVDAWGNPPGEEPLGMIIPAGISPLDSSKGWGVVITYSEEGHVDDEDAEDIDYAELLDQMKEDTRASNEQRVEQGYGSLELVGWAEPPHYDGSTKRLYWAKELAFTDSPEHTLNYAIRILGRKGVLELNAVATMSQLEHVRQDMKKVLPLAQFQEGQTYSDFDPDLDEVAAYGIGGLIAGKVLTKVGLFAGLLKLLVAFKKLILLGALGIGAFVMKLFKGRRAEAE